MNILRVCVISITVISHIHTHYIQPCVCIKYVSICTQHFYLFLHISCVTVTVTLQRFQPLSSRRARSILEEMDALLRERANSAKAEVGPMVSHPGGEFLPSGRDGYDIHSLP